MPRFGGTKVSFLGYDYPVLFPFGHLADVAVADPRTSPA